MSTKNELPLVALLAKQLADLKRSFLALSKQQGPKGEDGKDGVSIKGDAGKDGVDGKDGLSIKGDIGPRGPKGPKGDKGDTGPAPDHRWDGTELQFQKPDGEWGKKVDLRGPKGAKGAAGSGGGVGGEPFDPYSIELVTSLLPGDQMVLFRDGVLVRIPITTTPVPDNAVRMNGEVVLINGEYVVATL